MAFLLKIGEAKLRWQADEGVWVDVAEVSHPDAPAFGEPTDYSNTRMPGYRQWNDSIQDLGLQELMMGDCMKVGDDWLLPLMPSHPGVAPITKGHVDYVAQKIEEYKQKHPNAVADAPSRNPDGDMVLCRGEWMLYWMRWAVENCEKPTFYNS